MLGDNNASFSFDPAFFNGVAESLVLAQAAVNSAKEPIKELDFIQSFTGLKDYTHTLNHYNINPNKIL